VIVGTEVLCTVCLQAKKPRGRSAPAVMSLCDYDCRGYLREPFVGQLWPGETAEEFGYPIHAGGSDVERT
jgi:hypothetical protein